MVDAGRCRDRFLEAAYFGREGRVVRPVPTQMPAGDDLCNLSQFLITDQIQTWSRHRRSLLCNRLHGKVAN